MTQIVVGKNEEISSALRRFKRQVSKAGIFADMRKNKHFETPQEKKKRKAVARRKKRFNHRFGNQGNKNTSESGSNLEKAAD